MLWPGFSAFAPLHPVAPSSAEALDGFTPGGVSTVLDGGSGVDRQLVDLVSQLPCDPTTETPGLLPVRHEVDTPTLAMAQGPAFKLNDIRTPFLAGPLRPPCGTVLTA